MLPDISVVVGGVPLVVPGININFQSLGGGSCYGGLQRDNSKTAYIFGDVFLKGLYVVFEHPRDGPARLGFAQQRQ
jgi:aspergillopepsin I